MQFNNETFNKEFKKVSNYGIKKITDREKIVRKKLRIEVD